MPSCVTIRREQKALCTQLVSVRLRSGLHAAQGTMSYGYAYCFRGSGVIISVTMVIAADVPGAELPWRKGHVSTRMRGASRQKWISLRHEGGRDSFCHETNATTSIWE